MAKSYFKCGELRKVLNHCNDEDEIVIEFELGNMLWDYKMAHDCADILAQMGHSKEPHFTFRVNSAYTEATAYSSNSSAGYEGTLTLEVEVDDKERQKYHKLVMAAYSEKERRDEAEERLKGKGVIVC